MRRLEILTVPNLLTLSRFPLAAAFLLSESASARLAVIGVASLTDVLDGWLARRFKRQSKWGALLDPVADKTFVLVVLSTFLVRGEISTRDYFIILSRDVAAAIGFLIAYFIPSVDPMQFKARLAGKIVTALQVAILVSLVAAPRLASWLIPVIGFASAVSIMDYALTLNRNRRAA
ncbi:MAG: CDP-alcohol phosphatidyltransferase family protein [Gemmatimonadaceae bacterium]